MGPLNGERLTISIFLPGWIPRADALCANEGSNVVLVIANPIYGSVIVLCIMCR